MKLIIEFNGERHELELPEQAADALQAITERNGISLQAALEQAIANENFIEDVESKGARLLIEKDDKLRELVREPEPA